MAEYQTNGHLKYPNFNYISGVNIATARRIANFYFREYLLKMDKNDAERTYDIYLKVDVDPGKITYFRDFWGPSYRIYLVSVQDYEEAQREQQL